MTSPFAQLDAALSSAIDDAFAETATVSPFVKGDFAAAPDPARPVRTVLAVFSSGPVDSRLGSEGRGGFDGPTRRAAQSATLWIAAARLAALPYAIRPGDRVTLPGRGQTFEVASIDTTDLGDTELNLSKVTT